MLAAMERSCAVGEFDGDPYGEAAFRARAAHGLLAEPSAAIFDPRSGRALTPSDWDLDPELKGDLAAMRPPRAAAVLVPIVLGAELSVLLTQRSHDMPSHPGQISFPGGKVEGGEGALACALREACEEIGLGAEFIEPLGYLDAYRTGTGFEISPLVGLVRPGFALTLDRREVLEAFQVPLRFLMDANNHRRAERDWRGRRRTYYAITYQGRYIWGATAGMLKNMHTRLFVE
jgi:8-oxo-dGTP pyrophosphatase MutT (NUDIX family)